MSLVRDKDPNLTIRFPSGIPPPHRTAPKTPYRGSGWPPSASHLPGGITQQYHGLGGLYLASTDSHPTISYNLPHLQILQIGGQIQLYPPTLNPRGPK